MADVTDGTPPTGGSPFRPPEDFKAVYDHFGAPEFYSVATVADLPSTKNWAGRQLQTRDTGAVYVWNGGWKPVGPSAATSGVIVGAAPPAGQPLITKTVRTGLVAANSSGDASIVYPGAPFPNGVVAVSLTRINYDALGATREILATAQSLDRLNFRVYGSSGPLGSTPNLEYTLVAWGW